MVYPLRKSRSCAHYAASGAALLLLPLLLSAQDTTDAAADANITSGSSDSSCLLENATRRNLPNAAPVKNKLGALPDEYTRDLKYNPPSCNSLPAVLPSAGCGTADWRHLGRPGGGRGTLYLWGDSVTFQIFRSLARLLLTVAPLKGSTREKGHVDQTKERPVGYSKQWQPRRHTCHTRRCHRFGGGLSICFVGVLQHVFTAGTAPCLLRSSPHDVHFINTGTWHNDEGTLRRSLNDFLSFVTKAREAGETLPHVVWRETTPQHFLTKGGLYHKYAPKGCIQSVDLDDLRSHDYRNRMAREMIGAAGIPIMPLWELLVQRPDLHTTVFTKPTMPDCTHWCEYSEGPVWAIANLTLSYTAQHFWPPPSLPPDSQAANSTDNR